MPRKNGACKDCGGPTCRTDASRCRQCYWANRRSKISLARSEYARNWALKKKYNIDLEEFWAYWIAQRGRCYICNNPMEMPEKRRGQSLQVVAVDHDHKTGKMRSLLCNRCNKGMGFFSDDIELFKKVITYLEQSNGS